MISALILAMSLMTQSSQVEDPSQSPPNPALAPYVKLSPPEGRFWVGADLNAAWIESKDRGTPIIAIVLRDGDPICDSWTQQHLIDPAFRKVLEKHGVPALISLPGSNGKIHEPKQVEDDQECPIAGFEKCDQHSTGEVLIKDLPLPTLLPMIYLIDEDPKKSIPIPQEIPFRGAPALEEYLSKSSKDKKPNRTQYRFLLKHLDRAWEYDQQDEFEKGCRELVAAKRLLPLFSPRLQEVWDQAYAPYRGMGIQMIRRSKAAMKTNHLMGMRMLTRVAKTMADLPEGERARHMLNAYQK